MTVIGTNVRRADGEDKVRGTAVYGMDYTEPGALAGKILRSAVPAARIVALDTSKADGDARRPGRRDGG